MINSSQKQLHFIIGIGRSGTTILNKILNSHPSIHSLPEANFLAFFLNQYKNVTHFSEKQVELIFEQIQVFALSHPLVGYEFDLQASKKKIIALTNAQELTYESLCKIIYSEFKVGGNDKSAAELLVDKNPSYTLFVEKIAEQLPKAKFIFLVRDYRANILSRKQSVYLKSPEVAFNAYRWKLFNSTAFDFAKNNNKKVLLLKYEDLVVNSQKEIERICEFLGVKSEDIDTGSGQEYKVNLSDYNIDVKHEERFRKKYSDLNKPLNSARLNSWETQLSSEEIKICDALCSDFASQLGYQHFYKLSSLEKLSIKFKHFFAIAKAYIDVKKDFLIYYLPVELKLKRLRKIYSDLGFIKRQKA